MTTRKSHKQRGARWEVELTEEFRELGYDSERLARRGSKDEGDIVVRKGIFGKHLIVEAKAPGESGRINLSGWAKEAQIEAQNYSEARSLKDGQVLPSVIIKARGKSVKDSYVVFRFGDIFSGE